MIDFICPFDGFKICIYENQSYIDKLLADKDNFDWSGVSDCNDNVFEYPKIGYYKLFHKKLSITIHLTNKGRTVTISSSFHKLFNKEGHNAEQFYWSDFLIVHSLIQELLSLPVDSYLVNLEVGLNIQLPIEWNVTATEIVQLFLFISKKTKTNMKSTIEYPGEGYSIHRNTSDFNYKIYDKGMQYGLGALILRYEKKFIKSRPLNIFGYLRYSDLLNLMPLKNISKNLLKSWKKFIIYDDKIQKSPTLVNTDKDFLLKILRTGYFESTKLTKEEFEFSKNKYLTLLNKHSNKNVHRLIADIISHKLNLNS